MNLSPGILEFLGINLEFLELILEFLGKILEFLRINLEFLGTFCVYRLGILEFLSLVSSPRLDRGISSQNRYPWVKPEDDIVGNSRIPKDKSRIPRDCFASLAMTRILEFLSLVSSSDPFGGSLLCHPPA